ncbi:MAG: ATPase [Firmicutes bacterium HGW-Firmicutes-14]|nr:MAG: ATPase [Firmicutes bacterium HGW-Firmicutes-14]
MSEEFIFALDIGTRSVVGVVIQETQKGLEIIAYEHLEHQNRAMIDGQIHDIEQVAKAIKSCKEKIETKLGRTLDRVAVAAAGRALKTVRVKVNTDIAEYKEIHRDDILRLELQAVQEAQSRLRADAQKEEDKSVSYHCVGYSVVYYELDGFKIGNLYSQKGKNMSVEVIATFLPRVVVDSLQAALQKVGLEMTSLTLEPIAASAVVVPPSMRQLNIALIDIGAGTSDIAITDGGAITGYGMVPVAGDEITERISQEYLLDFNRAEAIKRSISRDEDIKFTDVLGLEHNISRQELLDAVSESVQNLTRQIAERIIELNGKTPQAAICIGGGSLTPLLKEMLAENLGLSKQRVAIRGREAITEVFGAQDLGGPEAVTPIGIAVTAYEHKGLGFARVMVNNRQVRLLEVNRGTVADALLAAGISMRKTQPRLGLALTVTVNGELKIIRGGRGKPAVIKLNGHNVTIDAPVKHNDVIEFVEALDGENAKGYIYDVVPDILPINISINEEPFTINPVITLNDKPVTYYEELIDNARVLYYLPRTAAEVMEIAGYSEAADSLIYVNERLVDQMFEIGDGDDIVVEKAADVSLDTGESGEILMESAVGTETGPVSSNLESDSFFNEAEGAHEGQDSVTVVYVNDTRVEIPRNDVILTDVLTRTNYPLRPPEGGMRLELTVNGIPAEFTTPLKDGDRVSLEWKNGS